MRESVYQARLITRLRKTFRGCVILKNDTEHLQGIPDLLVLYKGFWAMLEVKASAKSTVQPNQEYYVELLDNMSFAAFIYPENEDEVLNALQLAFKSRRHSRIPERL